MMRQTRASPYDAKQARSQATRDRLLDAAEAVLARSGVRGAVVPAIARRARVAVGSVYRRFPGKDALLQQVYERFFSRSLAGNRAALEPARWVGKSAADVVRTLVTSLVCSYWEERRLLAALIDYAEAHPDAGFRERAQALRAETFPLIGALLESRRVEMRHAEPEAAVEFALVVVGLALRGLALQEPPVAQPFQREAMAEQLTQMMLGYLGIDDDGDK